MSGTPTNGLSDARPRNPLLLPLIIVSAIAVIETIVLPFVLLWHRPAPSPELATAAHTSGPADARVMVEDRGGKPGRAPSDGAGSAPSTAPVARGPVGQRVESAGLGVTVEKIIAEPQTYKDQVTIGPDERYVGLLVLIENNTGGNAQLFPSEFSLRDGQGYRYSQLSLHGTMPSLQWRTMGNRETMRGWVDFVLPKSAKGLTLIYADTSRAGSTPIEVELGQ